MWNSQPMAQPDQRKTHFMHQLFALYAASMDLLHAWATAFWSERTESSLIILWAGGAGNAQWKRMHPSQAIDSIDCTHLRAKLKLGVSMDPHNLRLTISAMAQPFDYHFVVLFRWWRVPQKMDASWWSLPRKSPDFVLPIRNHINVFNGPVTRCYKN